MRLAILLFILGSSLLVNGDHLHEISILTGNDGMAAFFGQLSVKVFKYSEKLSIFENCNLKRISKALE